MKTTKKALLALVCAVALVFGSVFATYAYLTSTTGVVTNTFSVGNVTITLDEADVDGSKTNVTTEGRDMKNTYKLIPGQTYVKDPTVHVAEGSEDAWLFVKVENGLADYESDENTIAAQMTENGWKQLVIEDVKVENVFYHDGVVVAGNDYPVFEEFKVADTVTGAELAKVTEDTVIKVTAYAIQYAGFENNVTGAWTAVSNAENA